MTFRWHPHEQVLLARFILKWGVLATLVGVLGGSASAFFLVSLQWATDARIEHPWLLYLLPVGGLLIGLCYHWWGRELERGNNLLLEEIHRPQAGVPGRLAPAILFATVATHLFGGSAGREGTAVQMGGSLAGWLSRRLKLDAAHTRLLLMSGMSAGFGSVFGTPVAGTLFGLEVLVVGRMRYDALIPCLVASFVGDWTCTAWGVHHAHYPLAAKVALSLPVVGKVLIAALAFALVSVLFAELTSGLHWAVAKVIPWAPGRPVLGGVCVIVLTAIAGTRDYLGLGIPVILESFEPGGVPTWAFLWKLVFTAVTLGAGFKGGEVTPLFFIGATLGATLGTVLGLPTGYLAALGFVAVFAAAANTPLTCLLMGIELFGDALGGPLLIVCSVTYVLSGHRGIYLSQHVDTPKTDDPNALVDISLAHARAATSRPSWRPPFFSRPR